MMELIRCVGFAPYASGPSFLLSVYDTGAYDTRGCTRLAYRLSSFEPGVCLTEDDDGHVTPHPDTAQMGKEIFRGEDFCGSPLHADDSNETLRSLMTFLTLRPGDTDADYFADYTPEQLAFADEHAEALGIEADRVLGGEP